MMCALVIMLNVGTGSSEEVRKMEEQKREADRNRKYASLLSKIWDEEKPYDPADVHAELKLLFEEDMKVLGQEAMARTV